MYAYEKMLAYIRVRYNIYSEGNIWHPCGVLGPLIAVEATDVSS